MKPKVGLMSFSESREDVFQRRKHIVENEVSKVVNALKDELELVYFNPVRFKDEALSCAQRMVAEEVHLVVFHIPLWSSPSLVAISASYIKKPFIILGNERAEGLVPFLAVAGSLDQIGIKHKRILGDISKPEIRDTVISYCRVASVISQLRGQTYGYFGGRSLGMYTAVADLSQWQRLFGIDIEHIDQAEIIRLAETISHAKLDKHLNWFSEKVKKVVYNADTFTKAKLEKQLRSYLALRELVRKLKLDFIGLKCQTELSDHYVVQCIPVALMNDPYDADGPKEPIVCACEADCDGALTMQILKLLSGGKPTTLMDIRLINKQDGTIVLTNCGGLPTYFAKYSDEPEENLKHVYLEGNIAGQAGGGTTQFICGPSPVTLARLCRRAGKYWMAIMKGKFIEKSREELKGTYWPWPHAFLKIDINFDEFVNTYASNHIHAVVGDYGSELIELCKLLDIDYKLYC